MSDEEPAPEESNEPVGQSGEKILESENTTAYSYIYASGKLQQEKVTTNGVTETHNFFYDNTGKPYAMQINGTTYYYVTNLQGDVMGLVDTSGNSVASYTYDPYGKLITATGELAEKNPLRYRGYYYDSESGLYYLQSRYYDPATRRFVNADSYSSTGQGLIGHNMFAYCGNDPVIRIDPTGEAWWHWAVAAAIVVAAAAAVVVTAGGASAAIVSVALVANGIAASGSTALTVSAGVFIGASTAFAVSAYGAAVDSNSMEEFAEYGAGALISTVAGGAAGGASANALPGHSCFIAGTEVLTEDGTKKIEDIHAGEMVWAWDEQTGDVSLKKVVETYVNETTELTHIFVGGEEIVATPGHPFYSPVKGWTEACELRAGDILVLVNGEYVVVEQVQHELLESPVKVYNFQVEDYHTYYVGS
ncbi:MAG: polymorphic toxin-type HINT domain-containing protein, partial [Firmicutes bacterium]|nr:polymorphic toxin-type HINT domain-containing protein [Bacillota bacterium]